MTRKPRKTRRELERDVEDLAAGSDSDGFHYFQVGGDPDVAREKTGFYTWSRERGVYVNDAGVVVPPEDAPDSEFEYTVEFRGEGSADE